MVEGGLKEVAEDLVGDGGGVAEVADPACAGVEDEVLGGFGGEVFVEPVVGSNLVAKMAVAGGAAEGFDPGVFVGGYGLGSKLSADPLCRFC